MEAFFELGDAIFSLLRGVKLFCILVADFGVEVSGYP